MSLRLNLYGRDLSAFYDALGSGDSKLEQRAGQILSQQMKDADCCDLGLKWLSRMIHSSPVLRTQRGDLKTPTDGNLITQILEGESHIWAVHSLLAALSTDEDPNFSGESSIWNIQAISGFYQAARACDFTKSAECPRAFYRFYESAIQGTPVFGDAFHTSWSFYSIFERKMIAEIRLALNALEEYERDLSRATDDIRKMFSKEQISISDDWKDFSRSLSKWFEAIESSNRDALIFWW